MGDPAGSGEERPRRRGLPRWFNWFLFATTLFTTWGAGTLYFPERTWGGSFLNGLIYMASLMGILVCHEMGHYAMARRNRVAASLPYFIPVPSKLAPIGTMGAVILMRGRIRSRNALMEVGAAGPLAGMAVAIPVVLIGLYLSPVEPIPEAGFAEGSSILYAALKMIAVGPIPEGRDVILHPMAWAGWIGLLVTMINLLPIGQLDGGHVAYALWGEAHGRISRLFHKGLFLFGIAAMAASAATAWGDGLRGEALWASAMAGSN